MNKRETSIRTLYRKYVLQNIMGMLGMSAYILADTFFISVAAGADGITALNLVLPVYSLIFALAAMISAGASTWFKIYRARKEEQAEYFFSHAFLFGTFVGLMFTVVGIFGPAKLLQLLGANEQIISVGTPYTRIFLIFGPLFIWSYIFNAFTRNDDDPGVSMSAMVISSLMNIVMDYVFMFTFGLGLSGAALATSVSPGISTAICYFCHFRTKKNTIRFAFKGFSLRIIVQSCKLGVSAFVVDMASGISTMVFNYLILGLVGNVGVAAYGVVANTSLMATSIYNGIAQGGQPLFSKLFGEEKKEDLKRLFKVAVKYCLVVSFIIIVCTECLAPQIANFFNSEQNDALFVYAVSGIRLYFPGFLFAGCNIVWIGYLSAVANAKVAFIASMFRGVLAIVVCAIVLAFLFGMTGVWLAFPVAELITLLALSILVVRK